MVKKLLYFLLLATLNQIAEGQWKKVKEIDLDRTVTAYATDANNDLYLAFEDGSLVKYNAQGVELFNYSLPNQSPISLVDPQFQLRTFLFYHDIQQISILDRFNSIPKNYFLSEFTTNLVSMACPAPDGTFWIAENNPLVLKRIDPGRLTTLLEVQPPIGKEILNMKAYRNLLFITDELGLNVLDQFGTVLYQKELKEINYLTIKDDLLFFVSENLIIKLDPFTGIMTSSEASPLDDLQGLLLAGGNYIFMTRNQLVIYQETD